MINYLRIDERGVHGQTVVTWSKILDVNCILLVSDEVFNNPMLKKICENSGFGLDVIVFDTDTAIRRIKEVITSKRKYMVITKDFLTMSRIVKSEVDSKLPSLINVGPVTKKGDRKSIIKGIYLDDREIQFCEEMEKSLRTIEFQLLPESEKLSFKNYKKQRER